MEYNTSACFGDFRPCRRFSFQQFRQYRRPSFQPSYQQQPVYMVHASMPARFAVPRNYDRTYDKDVRKHPIKSKSNATKTRDRLRKQKFIENKTVCYGFPFSGLNNPNFQKEIVTQLESQETKRDSKLHIEAETIKVLQIQNKRLRSTIEALQCTQTREADTSGTLSSELRNDELNKLQEELEFGKQRVVKFVAQNVERQREINNLRSKLEGMIRHSNFAINQINRLQEEKQHQEDLIDIFKRFEKNHDIR